MILPEYPFRIEFEVTSVCNLDCSYCYAKPFSNITPPLDKIKQLFTKTQDEAKPFESIILGGEPFVRKDILDLLEFAGNTFRNGGVGISTNGTLIKRLEENSTVSRLKTIVEDNNIILQVSLDSTDPAINDKTRGKGLVTLQGIQTLDKYNIPFNAGIVVTTSNYDNIPRTVEDLMQVKSLRSISLEVLQPTFMLKSEDYMKLRKDSGSLVSLQRTVEAQISKTRHDLKVEGVLQDCSSFKEETPLFDSYGFKSCTAGLFRAGVFVNGEVTPCVILRQESLGNLYKESWKEIWTRAKERYLNIGKEDGGQCTLINLLRKKDNSKELLKIAN